MIESISRCELINAHAHPICSIIGSLVNYLIALPLEDVLKLKKTNGVLSYNPPYDNYSRITEKTMISFTVKTIAKVRP